MLGYVRRSKADRRRTRDESHGLDAQRAAIRSEADRRGWHLVWVEPDDNRTGANTRRPGLQAALASLAAGEATGLVVAKLDRLSRSMFDFADLLRRADRQGWSVVALDLGVDTSTLNGTLVAHVLMAVAEWERGRIAERTRDGWRWLGRRARGLAWSRSSRPTWSWSSPLLRRMVIHPAPSRRG
jgi:DNA invertase Pin-like site-specific DNA recombinase